MKRSKVFCLIVSLVLTVSILSGCGNDGGKTSLFGKYEIFTDADYELFQKSTLQLSVSGNVFSLGMTKDEIEIN